MQGYFIYCRKSSEAEDRQVLSIESQIRTLQELASKLHLRIIEVLTESKSAKEPGREIFNDMLKRLYSGEAAGIICWKLDRLARNPVDGGSVIWAIKQQNIHVVTPAQTYGQNDENVILMYIEFGMAQKYVDDLSKNVRRGLTTKSQNGWYPNTPPPGYLNQTDRLTGQTTIIKDPDRFTLVRRMWDLMLTGCYSPAQILQLATREWGLRTRSMRTKGCRPFARSAIYKIFTRPFYFGEFEYPKNSGKWHRGKHEPMVTEAEYDRVQELLGRRGNPRPRLPDRFAFTGLISCGSCGGVVTAEEKMQVRCTNCGFKFACRVKTTCPACNTDIGKMVSPRFLKYTYYHCTKRKNPGCTEKAVQVADLQSQITFFLSRIDISAQFKDWAFKYLHELHGQAHTNREQQRQSQERAFDECQRRIDNLIKLKTSPQNADGTLLSDEEYARARLDLSKEKSELQAVLHLGEFGNDTWLQQSADTFEFAHALVKRFENGDALVQKQILSTVGSKLTLTAKKLNIEAKKPFVILGDTLAAPLGGSDPFEPDKTQTPQGCFRTNQVLCTQQRASRDDVRTWQKKVERAAALVYTHFKDEFLSSTHRN